MMEFVHNDAGLWLERLSPTLAVGQKLFLPHSMPLVLKRAHFEAMELDDLAWTTISSCCLRM